MTKSAKRRERKERVFFSACQSEDRPKNVPVYNFPQLAQELKVALQPRFAKKPPRSF